MAKKSNKEGKDDKECSDLEDLKEEYNKHQKKYELPDFTKINEIFDIEETESDTEFFLRKLRKVVSDRVSGYLRFLEIILNPSNAPIFFFKLIKRLDSKEKERLTEIYEKLGNLEVEIIKLDLSYDEKNEADFIKKVFLIITEIRKDLLDIVNKMMNGSEKTQSEERSYFG